ncbi:hypothetical protein Afil01_23440 [Actinorhabdospora filicis]|uniref:Uncharacterized protein n=1 Tax=Actinorhabdospora filicis TaxID=1785913 RepID=A0A9W6SKL0_9ACTN|nr:hypothetical protein [Actinorhabdospora filicis]GLZ77537.1 hypothetical protein Afil01_23440 [Actinorhabdospora filicis]
MALGEVITRLIAVRGAIQTAIALAATASDETADAVAKAETALGASAHEDALAGLGLWRRAHGDVGALLAKLVAADEALAGYLEVLSPGSGRRNADIARPTGETLARRADSAGRLRRIGRTLVEKAGDLGDAAKEVERSRQAAFKILDDRFGGAGTTATTTGNPTGPVIRAPDRPAASTDMVAMGVLAAAFFAAGAAQKTKVAIDKVTEWRRRNEPG